MPGAKVERTPEGTTVVEAPQPCLHPTPERSGLRAFIGATLNEMMSCSIRNARCKLETLAGLDTVLEKGVCSR